MAYLRSANMTDQSLIEQTQHREQVIATAGARSIESFLNLSANSMAILANQVRVNDASGETDQVLHEFVSRWSNTPLLEVILIDKSGSVVKIVNKDDMPLEGKISLADRDYVKRALSAKNGEVILGIPILARLGVYKGQYIVPIASPIYSNGSVEGVVSSAIVLSELTKNYLDPLRISGNTTIYLEDTNGLILSSYVPELTGKNLYEVISQNPFPGSKQLMAIVKAKMDQVRFSKEGKLDFVRNDYYDKLKFTRELLVYSTVNLSSSYYTYLAPDTNWVLAVETPASDAFAFEGPFVRNQFRVVTMFIVVVLVFSFIYIYSVRLAMKEGYLDGYTDAERKRKSKHKI